MATQGNIVLAHGLFGFGNLGLKFPSIVTYFNGVAEHLSGQGFTVLQPQVNPIGSVAQRGAQLAAAIMAGTFASGPIHILAHSMGGLDARQAIKTHPELAQRIATVMTIGTPHQGSPVADAVMNRTDPLFPHLPFFLVEQLENNTGALHDLTTDACKLFNQQTPDREGIRYIDVAGDASQGGHELILFQLAAIIGKLKGEVNDGVVTKTSALRDGHQHLPDWPVDHAGEIGWTVTSLFSQPHLARYDEIVRML